MIFAWARGALLTDPAVRPWSRWLRPSLSHVPASLLISLVILTLAAWWVTIYQAVNMDMPMGIAVRGGDIRAT